MCSKYLHISFCSLVVLLTTSHRLVLFVNQNCCLHLISDVEVILGPNILVTPLLRKQTGIEASIIATMSGDPPKINEKYILVYIRINFI